MQRFFLSFKQNVRRAANFIVNFNTKLENLKKTEIISVFVSVLFEHLQHILTIPQ